MSDSGPDEPTEESADGPPENRNTKIAAAVGVVAMLLVGLIGWWGPWRDSTTVADTSDVATTSVPTADGPVAPLTGAPVNSTDARLLERPALVGKIDAAAKANPQVGLELADIVIELRVEGISRYMAAWQSQETEDIGPVRSARTSDPDLLAAFGSPLFAYSGANEVTASQLSAADWFQDVSHDAVPNAYFRTPTKEAPHDLLASSEELWDRATSPVGLPRAVFEYRESGTAASGEQIAGAAVRVGSDGKFAWDEQRRGWLRWSHGVAQTDTSGTQLAPTNVVVLETQYVQSAADSASPEAVSVGTGNGWVLSGGRMDTGTWSRESRSDGWTMTDRAGSPMKLEPGNTWVILAVEAPTVLSAEAVDALPSPSS